MPQQNQQNQPKMSLYSKYRYIWEQLDNTMDSLFIFIQQYLVINMDEYGNITVCNTPQTKGLPVFCCHLDTVHQEEPKLECINNDVLISFGGGGVGGDDKCGIIACLEMLESDIPCKCIFFRDEEQGCKGSNEYDATSLKEDLFCIEIDRKGANDLIFSACRGQMCSEEFQKRVKLAFPHGQPAQGSLTDVCVLGDAEINMMNLSAGYYRPHTDREYVVLSDLERNINCLKALTKDILRVPLKTNKYKRSNTYAYTSYSGNYWGKKSKDYPRQPDMYTGVSGYGTAGAEDYESLQYGGWNGSASDYLNGLNDDTPPEEKKDSGKK